VLKLEKPLMEIFLQSTVPYPFSRTHRQNTNRLSLSLSLLPNREIRSTLATQIASLTSTTSFPTPHLQILQLGSSSASSTYIRMKLAAAEASGMTVSHIQIPSDSESGDVAGTGVKKILELVQKANNDPKINGLLVQLPLEGAGKEEEREVVEAVGVEKDVDG
jgi:methylenetetrahydrofolate dehydrogenase (NADP+) / methenyltetrahydrofolate cyclohydrolase / formyltetrahydrofolate synthetase